jgi:hypothetical protein
VAWILITQRITGNFTMFNWITVLSVFITFTNIRSFPSYLTHLLTVVIHWVIEIIIVRIFHVRVTHCDKLCFGLVPKIQRPFSRSSNEKTFEQKNVH